MLGIGAEFGNQYRYYSYSLLEALGQVTSLSQLSFLINNGYNNKIYFIELLEEPNDSVRVKPLPLCSLVFRLYCVHQAQGRVNDV